MSYGVDKVVALAFVIGNILGNLPELLFKIVEEHFCQAFSVMLKAIQAHFCVQGRVQREWHSSS